MCYNKKEVEAIPEMHELHRLLGALLSQELEIGEKLEILETEYEIAVEEEIREEVNVMCNLSQGIKEAGIAIGEERGKEAGIAIGEASAEAKIIVSMYEKGFTIEQIGAITEKKPEEVEAILEGGKEKK